MSNFKLFIFGFFLITGLISNLRAVPALNPRQDVATCKTNPAAISARKAAIKAAPFFNLTSLPTTSYVLVIRVDFADRAMSTSKSQADAFFSKMKDFYLENSYGVLTVSATVSGSVYRLPNNNSYYADGICSNYTDLVKDSLNAATENLSNGAPGSRAFHHIMIYHAGSGAETTAGINVCGFDDIWSVFVPTVAANADKSSGVQQPLTKNGVVFSGATVVPETENAGIDPLGVICHEYGHQLGLPDLYHTSAQSVVGEWSLMDSGIYIGSPQGANPAHLDAWSKQFLGFSSPQTLNVNSGLQQINLGYSARLANAFVRIPISGVSGVDSSKEYFLLERRARSVVTGKTYDDALPFGNLSEGYLIWHIDDSIASNEDRLSSNSVNSGFPHFGIDLVEAASSASNTMTSGLSSDPFPGSSGQLIFASPHSDSFSQGQSKIFLSGFSSSVLSAKMASTANQVDVVKTINYPNPGGPSYAQKVAAPAGTVTTIVVQVSKPVKTIQMTIHDLSGTLRREVSSGAFEINALASSDNKFVYEYSWDGNDNGGQKCAPGIYLYRFKGDDNVVKSGQLVLVR